MQFKLTLKPEKDGQYLPFSYPYALSAWIYKLIARADREYADFLHNQGYRAAKSKKSFKDFAFSELVIPKMDRPKPGDTALVLRSREIFLHLSFYIDRSAENFIIGLFQNQQLSLYNRLHRADFIVERIEAMPPPAWQPDADQSVTVQLKPLSPVVVAEKDERFVDQYLPPQDPRFAKALAVNLADKYVSLEREPIAASESLRQKIHFRLLPDQQPKSRLITIKEGQVSQTRVRGYHNFRFELTAPVGIVETALYSGIGKYCAGGGCGFVQLAPLPVCS